MESWEGRGGDAGLGRTCRARDAMGREIGRPGAGITRTAGLWRCPAVNGDRNFVSAPNAVKRDL